MKSENTRLLQLIDNYKISCVLKVEKEGNIPSIRVTAKSVAEFKARKNDILSKVREHNIFSVNLDDLVPSIYGIFKDIPFKIKGINIIIENSIYDKAIIYVAGQNSDKIRKKWSKKLSNCLDVPYVSLAWTGGDSNVAG